MSTLAERTAEAIVKAVGGNAPTSTGVDALVNPVSYGLPSDAAPAGTVPDVDFYLPDADNPDTPVQDAATLTSFHATLGDDTVEALQSVYDAPELHELAGRVRPHVAPETHGALLAAAALHETDHRGARVEDMQSADLKRVLELKRRARR